MFKEGQPPGARAYASPLPFERDVDMVFYLENVGFHRTASGSQMLPAGAGLVLCDAARW